MKMKVLIFTLLFIVKDVNKYMPALEQYFSPQSPLNDFLTVSENDNFNNIPNNDDGNTTSPFFDTIETEIGLCYELENFGPCTIEQVNTYRRYIYNNVYTLAVDGAIIYNNDTPIMDETLIHRIGFIPVDSSSAGKYNYIGNCDCMKNPKGSQIVQLEGCAECSYEIELDVTGSAEKTRVTSDDFTSSNIDHKFVTSIYICPIRVNQRLKLKAYIRKGNGEINAKWSPVSSFNFVKSNKLCINSRNGNNKYYFTVSIEIVGNLNIDLLIKS